MNRRTFVLLAALGIGVPLIGSGADGEAPQQTAAARSHRPFKWEEATVSDFQAAMQSGKETAVSLAEAYMGRIDEVDRAGPMLKSVLEVNPDALEMARGLDDERKAKGPRGPLHGIPVLLKDNIDTHDRMMTTAGSLALLGSIPPLDAFVAQRLREAGAVILGKTNLSEWANFRGDRSTSGWSARGGQTKNPYVLDRNPSGSSSGSAVAVCANLCAIALGTETDGSIISPSSLCGIVGIKPTVGLISRAGIIPISNSQDTAGPMARSVRDAALLLGALTEVDPRDPITEQSRGKAHTDYTQFLNENGLRGARLGVARRFFRLGRPGSNVIESAIEKMKQCGAEMVELADKELFGGFGDAEQQVLLYEFKHGLNSYLASLGPNAPMRTLDEVIKFNERNKEKEMPFFGQEVFIRAQEKGPLTDQAYLDAVEKCRRLSRAEGIDALMDRHQLDAIVAPSGGPAGTIDPVYGDRDAGGSSSPAAVAGYPNITVPAGHVHGLPVGISFFGRAYSEPKLLKLAYAFEQATKARKAPRFLPTVE
ncbi:MAG: amidase [Verrucomicrobiales bacterium]